MKIIIETPRLYLRDFDINDAQNFYDLNLNPNVIRYTGNTAFTDVDEACTFLENYQDYKVNGYGRWAVISKQNNDYLGWCGLKYDPSVDETDIGFRFFEYQWNKGYATESAKACLEFGFKTLKLKTIVGRAMKDNVASIKVLEKIGLNFDKEFDFDKDHRGVIYSLANPY